MPFLTVLSCVVLLALSQNAWGDDGIPEFFQRPPAAIGGPDGFHGIYKWNNSTNYRAAIYFEYHELQVPKSRNTPYTVLKFSNHYEGPIIAGHGFNKNLHREIAKGIGVGRFGDASKRNPLLVISCPSEMSPGQSPAQIVAKEWGVHTLGWVAGGPNDSLKIETFRQDKFLISLRDRTTGAEYPIDGSMAGFDPNGRKYQVRNPENLFSEKVAFLGSDGYLKYETYRARPCTGRGAPFPGLGVFSVVPAPDILYAAAVPPKERAKIQGIAQDFIDTNRTIGRPIPGIMGIPIGANPVGAIADISGAIETNFPTLTYIMSIPGRAIEGMFVQPVSDWVHGRDETLHFNEETGSWNFLSDPRWMTRTADGSPSS